MAGRPKITGEEKLDQSIAFRVTKAQKEWINSKAKSVGMVANELAKMLTLEEEIRVKGVEAEVKQELKNIGRSLLEIKRSGVCDAPELVIILRKLDDVLTKIF